MNNPFKIEGNAQISFRNVIVTFANTGKEREETLDFVNECSARWDVNIRWIEYLCTDKTRERFIEGDYKTASRNGEPFEALIDKRGYLPNPIARFCTADLKISPMEYFLENLFGKDIEYDRVIGLRADEKRRVARFDDKNNYYFPLNAGNFYKKDVYEFWSKNNFDLNLSDNNGTTPHGNCDLCFLKGAGKLISLINENPEKAIWWMQQEEKIKERTGVHESAATFRVNAPSYKRMIEIVKENPEIELFNENELIDCSCTD